MPWWRGFCLALRGLGWTLLAVAGCCWVLFGYARLRLGEHRLPGVSGVERRLLWDKDDLYTAEGRRFLALCSGAFEVGLVSAVAGAALLAIVPAPTAD